MPSFELGGPCSTDLRLGGAIGHHLAFFFTAKSRRIRDPYCCEA